MMKYAVAISLVFVVLIAGCAEEKPITEITVPGHELVYIFRNDIRHSITIEAENENDIYSLFRREEKLNIVFNGSDESDNGLFQSVIVDIISKVPFYLAQEGKDTVISSYYFMAEGGGTQWYNATGDMIDAPLLEGATLMLVGPATGANETSVTLHGNKVTVQGTSYASLSKAADKLTLVVFGISDISQIKDVNGTFVYTPLPLTQALG